ncbi:MAG: hypothetical protein ACRDLY_10810, partial [Thermoleophilaceae bacterium]
MTRSALCVVAIVASLGPCNGDSEEPRQSGPTTSRPAASVPEPTARIPREAERLADRLTATQRALAATIDRWRD